MIVKILYFVCALTCFYFTGYLVQHMSKNDGGEWYVFPTAVVSFLGVAIFASMGILHKVKSKFK